jgi:ABC-type molybdate transport system substrate-binding protein
MAWYAIEGKYNTCYGHAFNNPVIKEFVLFNGVPVWYDVKGSSHGAMYRILQAGAKYDDMVSKSINYTRWLQIKRTYKLNLNATLMKYG